MYNYAQLDKYGHVIGISQLAGVVENESLVSLETEDFTLFGKVYDRDTGEFLTPPDGFYKAIRVNGAWTEGLTPEEIAELTNVLVPESVEQKAQRLESENANLREQLAETNANVETLTNALIELGVI
ncbi:bZIP transcription factor [Aneurinibacillus aneurinilyticus]|uniref:bZIP transcription factor n=1 Tax=Aneurinibacillus aneurinilyticus TaxID=1391 RepID=UPI0036726DA0